MEKEVMISGERRRTPMFDLQIIKEVKIMTKRPRRRRSAYALTIMVGVVVLISVGGGTANVNFGANALLSNTMGMGNTAQPHDVLMRNTALGVGALFSNTTGYFNTAVGAQSLLSNTTGDFNTAVGQGALYSNDDGNWNTALGQDALYSNDDGSWNTAVGQGALFMNEGNCNTAVGGDALYSNTTGHFNTAVGEDALYSNDDGNWNTAVGEDALYSNTTGEHNTALGFETNVSAGNLNNATAIGYGAVVNDSNKVRIGNHDVRVIEGKVDWTYASDETKKENFLPMDGLEVLEELYNIPVYSWNYIGQDAEQFRHYGPSAQDFFAAFGHDGLGTIGTETTITGSDLEGILMISTQALYEMLLEKDEQISNLNHELGDLLARLDQLEQEVEALK